MKIFIDAQLSPNLAIWIRDFFDIQAFSVKFLGLRDAMDIEIFEEAKRQNAVVLTKDEDFVNICMFSKRKPT